MVVELDIESSGFGFYKRVLNIAPHGIFAVDKNRNVVFWNRAAERITGLAAEDVLGKQCPFLELSLQCMERCALLNGGSGREEEVEISTEDGIKVLRKSFEMLKDDDGNVIGCVECFTDITSMRAMEEEAERVEFYDDALKEAKAMQEFYADVLNNLQTFVVVVDENGKIEFINDAVSNVEGLPKEELLGKSFVEAHWWRHSEDVKETVRKVMEDALSGKITFAEASAMMKRSRRIIPMLAYGAPLRRADGSIRGALLVGQDITEKKKLERQLQETIEKLKAAQEELSTPVIQVWDGVLALPIIGVVDSDRAMRIMETLLNRIVETQSEFVILDVTGVASMDTEVANHLMKTVQATALLGAECIITGIKPEVAQTMIHLGLDMGVFVTKRDLQDGLKYVLRRRGVKVAEG